MQHDRALRKANDTYRRQAGGPELTAATAAVMALFAAPFFLASAIIAAARRMVAP